MANDGGNGEKNHSLEHTGEIWFGCVQSVFPVLQLMSRVLQLDVCGGGSVFFFAKIQTLV